MKKTIATSPDKPDLTVNMTADEVAQKEYESLAFENGRSMFIWSSNMSASDVWMPRYVEDIIDALEPSVRARIAAETLKKYNDKKTLRSQKPV